MSDQEELKVGDVMFPGTIGRRGFEPTPTLQQVLRTREAMCWGANKPVVHNDMFFRFNVQGHHHTGFVYVILDWMDTFIVYYTDLENKIVAIDENVYVDQLVYMIDQKVEYVKEYVNG